MKNGIERHHYMFPAKQHESSTTSKEIRRMSRHIGHIEHDAHVELHRNIPFVPVMSHFMAAQALKMLRDFDYSSDPIHNIENLQRSIEYGYTTGKTNYIETTIGELAVHTLDLQKEYFKHDNANYL